MEPLIPRVAASSSNSVAGTPLHVAVLREDVRTAELLIARDANVNAPSNIGTPLHIAVRFNRRHIAEILVRAGADVNARSEGRQTPLHETAAMDEGQSSTEMISWLVSVGADIDARDDSLRTPLHHAVCVRTDLKAILNLAVRTRRNSYLHAPVCSELAVAALLKQGADVNAVDSTGMGALHEASAAGGYRTVELLLSHGADPNTRDSLGWTPLHEASAGGWDVTAEVLLRHGANANVVDSRGTTPLHMVSQNYVQLQRREVAGSEKSVESEETLSARYLLHRFERLSDLLVCRGADVLARDENGHTPAGIAVESNGSHLRDVLLRKAAERCILAAVIIGDLANLEAISQASPASVNRPDAKGRTPLHFAVADGRAKVVKALVRLGANVNALDKTGMSPLHCAVNKGYRSICTLLLSSGADANLITNLGLTPLHMAAMKSDELTLALTRSGADVNAQGPQGETPLLIAARRGATERVRHLLKAGADITATDRAGQTALHLAALSGVRSLVGLVLESIGEINAVTTEHPWKTALDIAEDSGHSEIADLLRSMGARRSNKRAGHWGNIYERRICKDPTDPTLF